MDTEQAYGKMQEANHIIEDFPIRKYVFNMVIFFAEIAICFAIACVIRA
ncbi:MAG: hypothetical protein ABSH17_13560 [Syntrophobacteraceae bacterium]|jgi:hypothetical protein